MLAPMTYANTKVYRCLHKSTQKCVWVCEIERWKNAIKLPETLSCCAIRKILELIYIQPNSTSHSTAQGISILKLDTKSNRAN